MNEATTKPRILTQKQMRGVAVTRRTKSRMCSAFWCLEIKGSRTKNFLNSDIVPEKSFSQTGPMVHTGGGARVRCKK